MDKIYYKELIEKYFDGNIRMRRLRTFRLDKERPPFTELVGRRIFQIGCRY